jgi:hypothetical protein
MCLDVLVPAVDFLEASLCLASLYDRGCLREKFEKHFFWVFPRHVIRVRIGYKVGIISIGGDNTDYRLRSNHVSKVKDKGYLK